TMNKGASVGTDPDRQRRAPVLVGRAPRRPLIRTRLADSFQATQYGLDIASLQRRRVHDSTRAISSTTARSSTRTGTSEARVVRSTNRIRSSLDKAVRRGVALCPDRCGPWL